MPQMNGLDLQRALLARRNAPPIIFITALLDEDISRHAYAAGAIACLSFNDEALLDTIRSVGL
jgi:FixJ family two-component response regulator